MFSDFSLWLYQQMQLLEEPTRFFAYIGLFIGLILLCFFLYWLYQKGEQKRFIKSYFQGGFNSREYFKKGGFKI